MGKTWTILPKKFNDVLQQLLYNRGIISQSENDKKIESFLSPNFETDFHDPELLPDFHSAINRISEAIKNNEIIGVYADYDADGIPGAALFFRALSALGCKPLVYIPTRVQGYGFNQSGIDYLIDSGCKLIISVDLGIREIEYAKYLAKKKIDLIITDHHEPGDIVPNALAVVNPKLESSKYPFRELCGTGVVFKIIQALGKIYPEVITEKFLKWNLDLVAISTISDVVPLVDENRVISYFGLKVLSKTRNIGLQQLYRVAEIDQSKIDAFNVGFQVGPRINAPGRLDHATASFELLVTEDKNKAYELALHLQSKNEKRQEAMDKIFQSATKKIIDLNLNKDNIIIVSDKNWQKGVIGPVASRLVEKFSLPVIVLSEDGDMLDGSCRSISSFDITKALEFCSKYLDGFGGHSGAAGVHLKKANLSKFTDAMIKYAKKNIKDEDLLPKLIIDLELQREKISINLFRSLEKLEPFGLGNSRPIFLTRNLRLISHRLVGKGDKHLQLKFTDGIAEYKGVVFNHDLDMKNISTGSEYDIVYQPGLNFWNGKNWIDLRIIDLKISEKL